MGKVVCEQTLNRPDRYEQIDVSAFSDMIGIITIPLINNNAVHAIPNDISEYI